MIAKTVQSLDDVPEEFRFYYVQAEGGGYTVPDELDDLVLQYNRIEAQCEAELAARDRRLADRNAQLDQLKAVREVRAAIEAAGVPSKWHRALAAVIAEHKTDDKPWETVIQEFLDSPDGEPYRPLQRPTPYFSEQITRLSDTRH